MKYFLRNKYFWADLSLLKTLVGVYTSIYFSFIFISLIYIYNT